jgi:hypothetical protein
MQHLQDKVHSSAAGADAGDCSWIMCAIDSTPFPTIPNHFFAAGHIPPPHFSTDRYRTGTDVMDHVAFRSFYAPNLIVYRHIDHVMVALKVFLPGLLISSVRKDLRTGLDEGFGPIKIRQIKGT